MNQRQARRHAHQWVADVIAGALGNGAADYFADDPADEEHVKAAIQEIEQQHQRKADGR